jgi:hypothetical protein
MLKADGISSIATSSLTTLRARTDSESDDTIIVGPTPSLNDDQQATLRQLAAAGKKLILVKPPTGMDDLIGITRQPGEIINGHLQIATGQGLDTNPIQFHGNASLWSLARARSLATITETNTPAVVQNGNITAFAYDLPYSVATIRQGNPDLADINKVGLLATFARSNIIPRLIGYVCRRLNGDGISRSDDLFLKIPGSPSSNWIDTRTMMRPQADLQTYLLGNIVKDGQKDTRPLPTTWYFPNLKRAVVVMTGDDHNTGATLGRFDNLLSQDPAGASVDKWTATRMTSYIWPDTPINDAQAKRYTDLGFEISTHIGIAGRDNYTSCTASCTPGAKPVYQAIREQVVDFTAKWPSAGAPRTNRNHCVSWPGYTTVAEAEAANGIGLDTNYYYWPAPSWSYDGGLTQVKGYMTGSALPMKFSRADGEIINTYQASTHITDETQDYVGACEGHVACPITEDTAEHARFLLDNATNDSIGWYGAITVQAHTDTVSHPRGQAVINEARALSIPVVSARQLLEWEDIRDSAAWKNINVSGKILQMDFEIGPSTAFASSEVIYSCLPTTSWLGTLQNVKNPANATTILISRTIHGIGNRCFKSSLVGRYTATYQ